MWFDEDSKLRVSLLREVSIFKDPKIYELLNLILIMMHLQSVSKMVNGLETLPYAK